MALRTTPSARPPRPGLPTSFGGGSAALSDLAWAAAAALASLILGAILGANLLPLWLIGVAIVTVALWTLLGPESVAAITLLTAFGFAPFVDPETIVMGSLPLWTVAFMAACAVVLLTWAGRQATATGVAHFRGSVLLALVGLLLVYAWTRLALSEPLAIPSTTARLASFAPAALLGYVVFSQPIAVANLKRALPLIVGVLIVWAVSYVAASMGQCTSCLDLVQSGSERPGLSGGASRLYTAGQESFNGLVLLAFGAALARPSPLTLGLAALGFVNIAAQATRAQYLAVSVGALLLLAWKFPRLRPTGRLGLAVVVVGVLVLIATGPVGERALSGYQDLSQSSGNAGYRLQLIDEASGSWSLFGQGVPARAGTVGFNFDLGLPNTLLGLGYIGALLQLAVLFAAFVRSLRAGGALGISLAAVFAFILMARPSLPLLEYGPSALAYGIAVGAACALPVAPRVPARDARPA